MFIIYVIIIISLSSGLEDNVLPISTRGQCREREEVFGCNDVVGNTIESCICLSIYMFIIYVIIINLTSSAFKDNVLSILSILYYTIL